MFYKTLALNDSLQRILINLAVFHGHKKRKWCINQMSGVELSPLLFLLLFDVDPVEECIARPARTEQKMRLFIHKDM
jgi:hypothetical protein